MSILWFLKYKNGNEYPMVLKKYGRKVWDKEIQCNKHNLLNEIHNYGETGRDT